MKYPSPSPSPLLIPQPSPSQIMIPSSSSELEGNGQDNNNGTKFWIEGISPEAAMEKIHYVLDGSNSSDDDDDDDGIEITPSLGSGILFNGYVRRGVLKLFLLLFVYIIVGVLLL